MASFFPGGGMGRRLDCNDGKLVSSFTFCGGFPFTIRQVVTAEFSSSMDTSGCVATAPRRLQPMGDNIMAAASNKTLAALIPIRDEYGTGFIVQ